MCFGDIISFHSSMSEEAPETEPLLQVRIWIHIPPPSVSMCYFYLFLFLCSSSMHPIPHQVVDGIIIPNYFSLCIIGLFILLTVMGEKYMSPLPWLWVWPLWHTLTNGNVSRYGTNHLQTEVLTVLRGLDCAPALHQENSMSQIETVLSVSLVIIRKLETTYCLLKMVITKTQAMEEYIMSNKKPQTRTAAMESCNIHTNTDKRTKRKSTKI